MCKLFSAMLIVLLLTIPALGDTIYIWTDKNGVKRFSDQPPTDVDKFETVDGAAANAEVENRQGLQQMFDQVERENRETDQRRAKKRPQPKPRPSAKPRPHRRPGSRPSAIACSSRSMR